MNKINRHIAISSVMIISAVLFLYGFANAESFTIKAPSTFYSIKLKDEERSYSYYGSHPIDKLVITTEGWTCEERYADKTIYNIREMNRHIQFLAETEQLLKNLEKVLIQMGRDKIITLSKNTVHNVVYRAIGDAIKKHNFSSESDLIETAEYMSKNLIEQGKDVSQMFGQYRDQDTFKHVNYGTPSGIWKLSKMEPDDPAYVVFVAQNCYQKQDLEAMLNAIVSSARKLEEITKSYVDTRDKVLALGK